MYYFPEEKKSEAPYKVSTKHPKNTYLIGDIWNLHGKSKEVFQHVSEWIFIEAPTSDTKIQFVIDEKHFHLFTDNVINRLLQTFRRHYKAVVLFELESIEKK